MKVSQVTLATIAEAAGVHKMTVSRALRNHPSISPATRARVQRIAEKLGYRPNPLLSIYQAHVRARRAPAYQATLAWINDNPSQNYWVATPYNRPYLDGVRARAEQLGYRIDELWLEDLDRQHPESNIDRFMRIMRARGIHGAILAPQVTKQHA
ncbi:MAG: LacI family DNA-binding transcriptional regulator, partial [Verrucomicrobiae bacterium]|nr:LacI family DNA-binding transcriptional regulator [Verrucomicrobiae bacterium]